MVNGVGSKKRRAKSWGRAGRQPFDEVNLARQHCTLIAGEASGRLPCADGCRAADSMSWSPPELVVTLLSSLAEQLPDRLFHSLGPEAVLALTRM